MTARTWFVLRGPWVLLVTVTLLSLAVAPRAARAQVAAPAPANPVPTAEPAPPVPALVLPLARTSYFVGETVPLAITGVAADASVILTVANADGSLEVYRGKPGPLWLDTAQLAPGDYALKLNGATVLPRFTLTPVIKRSAASLQDEATPPELPPAPPAAKGAAKPTPEEAAARARQHWDGVTQNLQESGLTAVLALGAEGFGHMPYMDTLARTGTLLLVNPDTRPTSFFPTSNAPEELESMSQRMILAAQANARYPNFGGFLYGWDTTGYAVGSRRGLLTYWQWGKETQNLRSYIERMDKFKTAEFTRRTKGLQPITPQEYARYVLAIGHPEQGPIIDLPTRTWMSEISPLLPPLPPAERAALETRLDAWSRYLMGLYGEVYGTFSRNLKSVDPSLRATASVQVDHAPTIQGQYFPSAYAPLDLRYQSTWNDQVGGPDYLDQALFVSALLDMGRGTQPTWISNALGIAHGRATYPGKFTRVAAQDLAWGGTGNGFALEGFSNILGGMNRATNWAAIKDQVGAYDLAAGHAFLTRFAALALANQGDHGIGILFSQSQLGRQNLAMGFGTPQYNAFITLTRLGYTPCFVTEEELSAPATRHLDGLLVLGQTVPLPPAVLAGLAARQAQGLKLFVDGSSTLELAGAQKLALSFPTSVPGKPHNWGSPSLVEGDNETLLFARLYPALAAGLRAGLGETGQARYHSELGLTSNVTLTEIKTAGPDAFYLVAINDSHVASQADWFQVRERLLPAASLTAPAAAATRVYDCTDERAIGPVAPLACDLSHTTARVYAVLARELKAIDLRAKQDVQVGGELPLQVRFTGADDQPLAATLPFRLSLLKPDGSLYLEVYRATGADGRFTLSVPLPLNVPQGAWSLAVRSQLNGAVATLPITVNAASIRELKALPVTTLNEPVVVRERAAITALLTKGTTLLLPLVAGPGSEALAPVAQQAKEQLAARGVEVTVLPVAKFNKYWLGYALTPEQAADNARVDQGGEVAQLQRLTLNGNDWYSALSGYRCATPLLLLDLAGQTKNPLVDSLAKHGMLWPAVTDAYPGPGRAVVQAVPWAFGPRLTTLVIQASDVAGLQAGLAALADLPGDRLTPKIQDLRAALWREYHVGGAPTQPKVADLTATGLKVSSAPQPFNIVFGPTQPPAADEVKHPELPPPVVIKLPAAFEPKVFRLYYKFDGKLMETATAGMLMGDLRFSEAIAVRADVPAAGSYTITAEGTFRYSDRAPCWQAQWEDLLALRQQVVSHERVPMVIEVWIGGKQVGVLKPVQTVEKEVMTEMVAGGKAKSVTEEVVTQLAGDITIPDGQQDLMFVTQHVVDGHLDHLFIGLPPPPPAPPKEAPKK